MKMNWKFNVGWITEGFCILPSLSLNWLTFREKKYYSLQFAWFWWYISFGNTHIALKDYK